jgi:3-hydroxyisobutyrate dehydrogenase-like beta-hydroxyacid dehydrogenase
LTSLEPYADTAAKIAGSPAELGSHSDLVCLCVVGDADVEEVLAGDDGVLAGMSDGGIVAIHSTVHPDTCSAIAESAAGKGVSVVDAPVSGGAAVAAERQLVVMVGGEDQAVERCRPVFETYGDLVVHLGGLGSGQIAKLLNNLLFTANLGIANATLLLGETLGVDRASLMEVLPHSSANSKALTSFAGIDGSMETFGSIAGALLQKDVRHLADVAERGNASPGVVLDAADAALTMMGYSR